MGGALVSFLKQAMTAHNILRATIRWVSLGVVASCHQPSYNHAKETAALIAREIPLGASVKSVEGTIDRLQDTLRLSRGKFDSTTHTLRALAGGTSQSLVTTGDLEIIFVFDSTNTLIRQETKEVFTGP